MGKGPLQNDLQNLIFSLGLVERIVLGGVTPDISAEYEEASIFAVPSVYESFGLAMVEAMARGVPAVGFEDCPGINELIVDDVNGYLVQGADRILAYAGALRKLMIDRNARERMGMEARKTASKFSIDIIALQWEKFLAIS